MARWDSETHVPAADPRALAALGLWRQTGDAKPWAEWLRTIRNELDDETGSSLEYVRTTWPPLRFSAMTLDEMEELANASRPILAELLGQSKSYDPWPVSTSWWMNQIQQGQYDASSYVAQEATIGSDIERPNGARIISAALGLLQGVHDLNEVYYDNHEVLMDDASMEGVRLIREMLLRLADLASDDAAIGAHLLVNSGEPVKIREHLIAENERLRSRVGELADRVEAAEIELMKLDTPDP